MLERGHVDDVVRGASEGGQERARSERERRVGGDGSTVHTQGRAYVYTVFFSAGACVPA